MEVQKENQWNEGKAENERDRSKVGSSKENKVLAFWTGDEGTEKNENMKRDALFLGLARHMMVR
jgi:hypothetical protein